MSLNTWNVALAGALLVSLAGSSGFAGQENLTPNTDLTEPVLKFDWPAVQIGIGSYEEGPTGLTIVRFSPRALAAVDVRGGLPGTINTDILRQGWELPYLDAIVFAGGSLYGEEAITAVATGLKDAGTRSTVLNNIGLVAGAVIYDFQGHRLNEIYPDKALGRAALKSLRPGVFPLGAQGAGRMAMQGGFLGCAAHSGQGGAFRQIGSTKIAAFVVVNSTGSITDRDGRLVKCLQGRDSNAGQTSAMLARLPVSRVVPRGRSPSDGNTASGQNTTLSIIATNRKLSQGELQRLAVQVHASMTRAIQPFSTFDDGDTLFAVSTEEVTADQPRLIDLDTVAGEVMWDAILASVPSEQYFTPSDSAKMNSTGGLESFAGVYRFGSNATIKVSLEQDHLAAETFSPAFFDLYPRQPVRLQRISETEFYVDGLYRTRFSFIRDSGGNTIRALVNPGRWQQAGDRIPNPP